MQHEKSLKTLLKQAEIFYSDFGRHLKLMELFIERLKAGSDPELLIYELELTTERMANRHSELGRRLYRLSGRKAVYEKSEE